MPGCLILLPPKPTGPHCSSNPVEAGPGRSWSGFFLSCWGLSPGASSSPNLSHVGLCGRFPRETFQQLQPSTECLLFSQACCSLNKVCLKIVIITITVIFCVCAINPKDMKAQHLLCWLNDCYNDWHEKGTSQFLWYFREQRHTFHPRVYLQDLRMRLNSAGTWQCQWEEGKGETHSFYFHK